MTTITVTISDESTHYDLRDVLPGHYGALCDMLAAKDYGTHRVESGIDDNGDGDVIHVLFLPDAGRAAIDTNGGTHWTDAKSIEDAIMRFRSDEMAN